MATQTATDFFYEHAGWGYQPAIETEEEGRRRGAELLASAELVARQALWSYEWREDPEPCLGCECGSTDCACYTGEPHEALACILYDAVGNVLASLWGICEPSREYRRVVEAELAYDAIEASNGHI